MPSPDLEKDEIAPAKPKTPTAPQRTSPTKTPPNGTPNLRKPGVKPRPTSAPIHKRPPSSKKAEPTLLTDFLLGRPSASRQRRKSLDAVKAEMRESTVNRIQKPGGVHDRVKQWQKASAAAAIEEVDDPESELDEITVEIEEESVVGPSVVGPSVVTEDNRRHVKNQHIRPGRRKSRDPEGWAAEVRSKSAPRKRVISDDHWVMNKNKTSPKKKEIKVTTRAIPKDFLKQTAANPKLENKIADWVKRTEAETEGNGGGQSTTSRASKTSQPETRGSNKVKMRAKLLGEIIVEIEEDEEPKRKSSKNRIVESKSTPSSRKNSNNGSKESLVSSSKGKHTPKSEPSRAPVNDGIRVKPSGPSGRWDDGIRVKPVQARWRAPEVKQPTYSNNPFLDGISLKPTPVREDKQAPLKSETPDEYSPHRRKSGKHPRPQRETERKDMGDHSDGELGNKIPPTPSRRSPSSKRQLRKSRSPSPSVDEIPFGDSAFSTLDLPIGAEAGNTVNRPKPQRNPSHLVPKVFKQIYNEGKKIIQDTHDTPEMPPRGGVNRPPTIESWLNNTTDPFLDVPSPVPTPKLPEESTKGDDDNEKHVSKPDQDPKQSIEEERKGAESRPKRVRKASDNSFRSNNDKSPLGRVLDDPIEFKRNATPPAAGIRRSPALRAASPPVVKSARKSPFKDALMDAFRGESTFVGDPDDEDYDQEKENHDLDDSKHPDRGLKAPENNNSRQNRSSGTHLEVPDYRRDISDRPRRKRRGASAASVETFNTLSSVDTSSNLTKTTLTQATTQPGRSDSSVSRRRSNRSGLKRRLTKHSDLVSMLSLPDAPPAGRTKSIRSARSVRTARSSLETATELDLMRELAADEVKYMRELKTLVDGVIPVLLTCVLSKSDSAIAAGLFNPECEDMSETFLTKPIVDMGVALERLKSLHRRIPLEDLDSLVVWLQRAHRTYEDYTRAWRLGFQDVVVNLAPASRRSSVDGKGDSVLDSVPRNADGDVVNSNGERVDVAFLLRRPLVRIKYLAKLTKVCFSVLTPFPCLKFPRFMF